MNNAPITPRGYWGSTEAQGNAHDDSFEKAIKHLCRCEKINTLFDLCYGLIIYAPRLPVLHR